MFTSNFARAKQIPVGYEPVAIAIGVPAWYKGRRELRLAPTRAMLKMRDEEYDAQYDAILAGLDPHEIAAALGENAVLLCWEPPGQKCHRRRRAGDAMTARGRPFNLTATTGRRLGWEPTAAAAP